jgi:hypothetical protein
MVDPIKFGDTIKPLEQRFKKLNPDQQKVYYDRLKWSNESVLEEAVNALVDKCKVFPSPGEIKDMVREVGYARIKAGKSTEKEKGCPNCHNGVVFYEVPNRNNGKIYAGSCAFCYRGDVTIVPFQVQLNDQIFDACEMFMDGSTKRFRANPDIQELYADTEPCYSSAWLKGYFESRRMGG